MREKIYNNRLLVSLILSFLICIGLSFPYISEANALIPSGIFSVILYVFMSMLVWHFIGKVNKRAVVIGFIFGFILALCQRIGAQFSAEKTVDFKSITLYVSVISLTILFAILISLFLVYREIMIEKADGLWLTKKLEGIIVRKNFLWICYVAILVCWIPAFLGAFPGIYTYDAGPQVWQFFYNFPVSAHHPLIHTFLLDGCLWFGHLLTNDYNYGLALYVLVQMLFMAYAFSASLNYLKKRGVNSLIILFAFLFLAVNPISQIWVVITTKDVIFGGFFLLVFIDCIEMLRDRENFFKDFKRPVRFVFIALLMCLFRNQGIYVLAFCLPFAIIFIKNFRRQAAIILILPIIITKIITGPVSDAFNVQKASPKEALSVPIQQLARVLYLNPDSVSDEEKEIIYSYIDENVFSQYMPQISDPVKEGFNSDHFKEDAAGFIKIWLSVGFKNATNLSIYIDSFLYGSYGYFYLDETPYYIQYILYDGSWLDGEFNVLGIQRNSLFPLYDKYLRKVSTTFPQQRIPVVSAVTNEAFPFWMLIILSCVVFYKKNYKLIPAIILFFGYWGTLLLGPVIALRYAYPLVICVPVLLGLLFIKSEEVN